MLTQLSRVGEMTKTSFKKATVSQETRFVREGSILAGTAQAGPVELVTNVDIESDEPVERVRHLVRMAEQTCFALQSMVKQMPVRAEVTLNGAPLEVD